MTQQNKIDSVEALKLLMEGNQRFISGLRSVENFANSDKLKELADKGQSPFAIILTCSDSRVPTETIFDRGFGDLFVIRVAGNVTSPSVIGSMEFAATAFGTPLVVVMGHSQCGAVKAAIASEVEGKVSAPSHIGKIVAKVRPAVRLAAKGMGKAAAEVEEDKLLHMATIANVRRSAGLSAGKSPILQGLIDSQKLMIVGAVYDLHAGRVDFDLPEELMFLNEKARQRQLLRKDAEKNENHAAYGTVAMRRR